MHPEEPTAVLVFEDVQSGLTAEQLQVKYQLPDYVAKYWVKRYQALTDLSESEMSESQLASFHQIPYWLIEYWAFEESHGLHD